jgi:translation initiation factor 2 alpha subunit (eIF-2alpha)
MKYKEGDLILCKVKKVTNTITFVELPNSKEGTIISSEIAAGRIKLMRQYVVPNKQILKDEESEIKEKILKDFEDLYDFATKAKTDETLIQKYIPSKFQEQLGKIINKKRKNEQFKKIIQIKCLESDGLNKIKNTLDIKNDKAKTTYITAGKFSLHLEVSDPKQGKKEMQEITEELEKKAKKNNCEIFITDDK